jgi:orotate phosphoribosyltransferase
MATEISLHVKAPDRVLLVDDVITRGATLIAAAARLREAFPDVSIQAFALARTDAMGDNFYDLCLGEITVWPDGTNIHRNDHVNLGPSTGSLF